MRVIFTYGTVEGKEYYIADLWEPGAGIEVKPHRFTARDWDSVLKKLAPVVKKFAKKPRPAGLGQADIGITKKAVQKRTAIALHEGVKNWVGLFILARHAGNVKGARELKRDVDNYIKKHKLDKNLVYFYYGDPDKPGFDFKKLRKMDFKSPGLSDTVLSKSAEKVVAKKILAIIPKLGKVMKTGADLVIQAMDKKITEQVYHREYKASLAKERKYKNEIRKALISAGMKKLYADIVVAGLDSQLKLRYLEQSCWEVLKR